MTNIFIANLDWEITSDDLKSTFSAFGSVHLAHVVFDAKTKKSKGFGYVEMESAEEAIAAIQALNGFEVNGRKLDVKIASPKANRPKPEDKPRKPFAPKGGGGGGGFKKRYDNNRGSGGYSGGSGYSGGGGNRSSEGGGYNSGGGNREGGYSSGGGNREGGYNSGGNRSWNNDRTSSGSSSSGSSSSSDSGERKLRPRRKFDN